MAQDKEFRFRQTDRIGSAAAEDDDQLLSECFVDTGALDALLDVQDPRCLIVGRTGVGKTALIAEVERRRRKCIDIKPESLALAHISNSTILAFLESLGVNLDIFFRLLWRHVFCVELIKDHFSISSQEEKHSVLQRITGLLGFRKTEQHKRAIDYLNKWGQSFWKSTDYRTKEVTRTLEKKLEGSVGVPVEIMKLGAAGSLRLEESQRIEAAQRAQEVINEVQIRELTDIIELIDDVLEDPQKPYFVTIDRLDEEWVDARIRLKLIRALVETIRDFRKVKNLKIIAALRVDLLSRMFRKTRSAGFQEEKYQSLYLEVKWSDTQLEQVLDARVRALIKHRYTKAAVGARDILPEQIEQMSGLDYMIQRCMGRPRDIIMFFNECIIQSDSEPVVSGDALRSAEAAYSRGRVRALSDEWYSDYRHLELALGLLKKRSANFKLSAIAASDWDEFALELCGEGGSEFDEFEYLANEYVNNSGADRDAFIAKVIRGLFRTGAVGLKTSGYERFRWASGTSDSVSTVDIDDRTGIRVHPCLWRALGIHPG